MKSLKKTLAAGRVLLLAAPIFLFAGVAHGQTVFTNANVLTVGQYGNGDLFITTDLVVAQPGCSFARVEVASAHPLLKTFMAMALTAKSAGSLLRVGTTGCNGNNYATIDATINGRMAVMQ